MEPYRPFVDQIVLKIIDKGENFLELGTAIKTQLLGIATVDVSFERGTSPLMVGIQYTTASLAKCFEGSLRKINYPLIKDFDAKKVVAYGKDKIVLTEAAEEEPVYKRPNMGDDQLPF